MRKLLCVIILLLSITPHAFASENEVTIKLPEFDVSLNGTIIDNSTESYPFIHHKGITYIPMTWDLSNALGLKLKWNAETGLNISKNTDMTVYEQKKFVKNNIGGLYQAKIVTFPVTVNGRVIDNTTADYPLLNFRNITYFPMTYHYMVTEFGSGYKWNNETGLAVAADSDLKVHVPKAHAFTLSSSLTELKEKGLASNQMLLAVEAGENTRFIINGNANHQYDGYIVDAEIDLYDVKGDYIHTQTLYKGAFYESKPDNSGGDLRFLYSSLINYDQFVIRVNFEPPASARANYQLDYADLDVEYVEDQFNLSEINATGAVYARAINMPHSVSNAEENLIPYALLQNKGYYRVGDEYYNVGVTSDGKISTTQ